MQIFATSYEMMEVCVFCSKFLAKRTVCVLVASPKQVPSIRATDASTSDVPPRPCEKPPETPAKEICVKYLERMAKAQLIGSWDLDINS